MVVKGSVKGKKPNLPNTYRIRVNTCKGIITAMWASLGGPLAEKLLSMDFESAVEYCMGVKLIPNSYADPLSYYLDAQCLAVVKKNTMFRNNDADKRAKEKFVECEERMEETNRRFSIENFRISDTDVESILFIAQRKIGSWLGDVDPFDMRYNRFGPGASFETQPDTSAFAKIVDDGTITPELVPYFSFLKKDFPGLFGHKKPRIVKGSRLDFVPKNMVTDRPIAIEPSVNMFLQLGLGTTMKQILLQNGCNLYDQSRNQRLAAKAHIYFLATVDLTSASDLISTAVVASLLPFRWYAALDLIRSKYYTDDNGETFKPFHKFSTMGNGFTFELESMIFYALALAICEHMGISTQYVSVYGDDIIVPREIVQMLYRILDHIGAVPNKEKSFLDGQFFESCGEDFYKGYGVRPVYIDFSDRCVTDVYQIHNDWCEIQQRIQDLRSIYSNRDDCYSYSSNDPVRDCILRALPSSLHYFGPKIQGRERAYLYHEKTGKYPGKCSKGTKGVRESTRRVDLSSLLDNDHVLTFKLYSPAQPKPKSLRDILDNRLSYLEPIPELGYNVRAGKKPGFQLRRKLVNLV